MSSSISPNDATKIENIIETYKKKRIYFLKTLKIAQKTKKNLDKCAEFYNFAGENKIMNFGTILPIFI